MSTEKELLDKIAQLETALQVVTGYWCDEQMRANKLRFQLQFMRREHEIALGSAFMLADELAATIKENKKWK